MEAQAQAQALSDQPFFIARIASNDIRQLSQCHQLIGELLKPIPLYVSFLDPKFWKEELPPEIKKAREMALEIQDKIRELQSTIDIAAADRWLMIKRQKNNDK